MNPDLKHRAEAIQANPVVSFVREVLAQWSDDHALSHGAALAYYTLFSLAPLLILVIAIAGLALGEASAKDEIVARIREGMGPEGAKAVEGMIEQASRPASGIIATVGSLLTMLFGASGLFGQLQASLNQIFRAEPPKRGALRGMVQRRLTSFGLILSIGFLLLVSLVLSAAIAALRGVIEARLPGVTPWLSQANLVTSFLVITALFALIFKVLPDRTLAWSDVWLGAAFTSLLFAIGKGAIALYLGHITGSVYGAASSLVLVLLWIYYSSQILFLGAEFTEVYARRLGSRRGEPRPPDPNPAY